MGSEVLGIVRYSVITESGNMWHVGKQNNFEAYKTKMWELDRLTQRLDIFWHESGDIVSKIDENERLARMAAIITDPVERASVVDTFSLCSDVP